MRDMTWEEARLRDVLNNLRPGSIGGTAVEAAAYAKGILVGVVATLQAKESGSSAGHFDRSIAYASELAPKRVIEGCCPASWRKQFGMPVDQGSLGTFVERTEGIR